MYLAKKNNNPKIDIQLSFCIYKTWDIGSYKTAV